MFCVIPLLDCQKENVSLAQARYSKYNLSNCSNLHLVGSSKLNSIFFTNSGIERYRYSNYLDIYVLNSEGSIHLTIKMVSFLEYDI